MRLALLILFSYLLLMSPFLVVVSSESMEPTLKVGDIVVLSHRDPQIGDVIVYQHGDILIIHRLVGEEQGYYITKGDNYETNKYPDPRKVSPSDVRGVAILRIPYLGYLALRIREYPVIIIILVILAVLYEKYVPEIRLDRRKLLALAALSMILILLRIHPRTPEDAYLKDREAYYTSQGYYVFVIFYSSGNTDVVIHVDTPSGSYEFIRHYIYPGSSGLRSVGFYIKSQPVDVSVWKKRSLSGERSMRRKA